MAGKVVQICQEKINPIIEKMGYEVVEVEYAKKSDGMNLTFFIDKDDGITIEDCEKVNQVIEPLLDELNPTNDATYILNVSSPGIDRPIKTNRDYLRNKDKLVEVTLYSAQNGKKKYKGILRIFNNDFVEIEVDGVVMSFEQKNVAQVSPVIEF